MNNEWPKLTGIACCKGRYGGGYDLWKHEDGRLEFLPWTNGKAGKDFWKCPKCKTEMEINEIRPNTLLMLCIKCEYEKVNDRIFK